MHLAQTQKIPNWSPEEPPPLPPLSCLTNWGELNNEHCHCGHDSCLMMLVMMIVVIELVPLILVKLLECHDQC